MGPHSQQTRLEAIRLFGDENLSKAAISRRLQVSYTSVRTWLSRYQAQGDQGLIPAYSACGRPAQFSPQVICQALEYKRLHPLWGAPFILLKLADDFPNTQLPKARRLQQLFRREGLQPKRNRFPRGPGKWAKRPFDRVQVDAKELLKTADGQACCYLNFTDEYTGSELDAFVFPLCPNL